MDQEWQERYWIDVQVDGDRPVDVAILHRAALATLAHQSAPPVEVAIVVSGDDALQDLNRRFHV